MFTAEVHITKNEKKSIKAVFDGFLYGHHHIVITKGMIEALQDGKALVYSDGEYMGSIAMDLPYGFGGKCPTSQARSDTKTQP